MPSKVNGPSSELPTSTNPYTVLSLSSTATSSEIKTAYKKLALRHHPDKVPPSERSTAHTTFQNLAFAYAVLSDERRRKRFDATGNTSESLDTDDSFDWTTFFRDQYADVITEASLDKIKAEYQDSEEEIRDVLAMYTKYEGNMDQLYERVMMSNVLDDDERFRAMIDGAIQKGDVEAFDEYENETDRSKQKRIEKAKKEAKQAAEYAKELKSSGKLADNGTGTEREKGDKETKKKRAEASLNDLAALIQERSKARGSSFLDNLEAKYSNGKKKKRASKDEPPEEAFEKTAKRPRKKERGEPPEEAFAQTAKRGTQKPSNLRKKQRIGNDEDDEETLGSEDSHSPELESEPDSEPEPDPPVKKRKHNHPPTNGSRRSRKRRERA